MRVAPGKLTAWPDPIAGPVRVRALVRLGAAPYWWQNVLVTARPVAMTPPAPTGTPYWWAPKVALTPGAAAPLVLRVSAAAVAPPPLPATRRIIVLARPTRPISTAGAGTGPTAPLATNTAVVNAVPIARALDPTQSVYPIPSNLAAVLDDATALAMREYVALHPDDFQAFLTQYADRLVLHSNLFLEALQDPPVGGYQLTPQMVATLGGDALKVTLALKGIAAGRWGDIFGMSATVAGAIPGVDSNFIHALQGVAMAYTATKAITSFAQVSALAAAKGVSVVSLGAWPGLAAATGAQLLSGVMFGAGLAVDVVFTIMGDAPDIQKAIDTALDVASLAVLFIPGIGMLIALVIQIVKFIFDLFAGDLFGGGLSHEQRELLETARYSEHIQTMYPQLADAYTPRELFLTIVHWGSGYCGGIHDVAMQTALLLKAGDQLHVGGRLVTIPADTYFNLGDNDRAGGCYWLKQQGFGAITNDEQAWALARYATANGVRTAAQVGIAESKKGQFTQPADQLIAARAAPMATFVAHGMSLDQIDQVAAEYRAQAPLGALAAAFGWANWQTMLGDVLADEWAAFSATITHGSLADFARAHGYQTMYDFRRAALGSYQDAFARVQALEAWYGKAVDATDAAAQQLYMTAVAAASVSAP